MRIEISPYSYNGKNVPNKLKNYYKDFFGNAMGDSQHSFRHHFVVG